MSSYSKINAELTFLRLSEGRRTLERMERRWPYPHKHELSIENTRQDYIRNVRNARRVLENSPLPQQRPRERFRLRERSLQASVETFVPKTAVEVKSRGLMWRQADAGDPVTVARRRVAVHLQWQRTVHDVLGHENIWSVISPSGRTGFITDLKPRPEAMLNKDGMTVYDALVCVTRAGNVEVQRHFLLHVMFMGEALITSSPDIWKAHKMIEDLQAARIVRRMEGNG